MRSARGLGPRERQALLWSCLIFVLCDLVLLLPGWWEHGLSAVVGSAERDMGLQFYIWRDYAREALLSGRLPEWNPHLFVGAPFLAAQQSAPFYPLNWPLLVLPTALGICLERLVHQLIAQVGAWLLARRAGASQHGALLAGVIVSLGSSMSYRIFAGGACALDGQAWAPWVLLAGWLAVRGSVGAGVLLGTAASSLQILAGYPQMAQLTWFGLLPWLAALAWHERLTLRDGLRRVLPFVLVVPLFTTLASSAALVPSFDLAARSARRGFDPAWVGMLSFAPRQLLTLVAPDAFGATWAPTGFWGEGYPWEATFHVGVAALALASFGLRGRRGFVWAVPCVCLVLIAFGKHNPLFLPIAEHVPGAGIFRGPAKHLLSLTPYVAVLAALGLSHVVRGLTQPARRVTQAALGVSLLLLLGLFGCSEAPEAFAAWASTVASEGEHFYPIKTGGTFAAEAWAGARDSLLLGLLWGSAALLTILLAPRLGARRATRVLVALALLELLVYGCGRVAFFSAERYELPLELEQRLRSDGPQRVALLSGEEVNRPMAARLETLSGYEAVLPARVNAFYNAWEGRQGQRYMRYVNRVDGVTRLLGQRFVVTPAGVFPGFAQGLEPPLQHVLRLAKHDLWVDPAALPRAFLVDRARVVEDREALVREVVAEGFEPLAEVLLESEPGLALGGGAGAVGERSARVLSYAPEEVLVEVLSPRPTLLVLSDGYDEGWSATVNEQRAPLLPAYGLIRAVPLSAGRSRVRFRFRSPARTGIALSALGLLLWAGMLGWVWRRR